MTQVDVVVPVYRDVALTMRCLHSVLEHSGSQLGRLIVVDDASPEREMQPALVALRDAEPRVRLLSNGRNVGFVHACNRGLSIRDGHVVILNSDTEVTRGWLEELTAVLDSNPRIAAVCPISNNATLCSVPRWGEVNERDDVRLDAQAVQRVSFMPTGVGFCMLLRHDALEAVGLFDPAYGRGYNEENDWCQRARDAGYLIARANRAVVFHVGEVSFSGARAALDAQNLRRLVRRYPAYLDDNRRFASSADAHVAATAHRVESRRHFIWREFATTAAEQGLSRWLRDSLEAAGAVMVPTDELAEGQVVVGTPSLRQVEAALESHAPITFIPLDLAALRSRPTLMEPERAEERLAAALLLSRVAEVWVSDQASLDVAQELLGPLPHVRVLSWPVPRVPPVAGVGWVMPVREASHTDLVLLLSRWAAVSRAGAPLEIWCESQRVATAARDVLSCPDFRVETPAPEARLARLLSAEGIVAPPTSPGASAELSCVLAAGQHVEFIQPWMRFEAPPRRVAAIGGADWVEGLVTRARTGSTALDHSRWAAAVRLLTSRSSSSGHSRMEAR